MPHLAWPPIPQLQHRKVRYGSVCSGIEAATVAWHVLPGWEPAWFSQFDPEHTYKNGPDFPSAVLAERFPGVPNLGDMTAEDWMQRAAALGDIDVLVGGTPCQDFSVAGLRLGLHGDRGQLTLRFCQIANAANPIFTLWENVPGVLSDKTNGFGCLLAGLAGEDVPLVPPGGRWTDAGVVSGPTRTVAWRVLDAQYAGLAQRRRRVFALACPRTSGVDPAAVLLEFDSVRRDSPPSRAAREDAAAAAGGGAAGAGRDGGAGCVNIEAGLAEAGNLRLRDICEPLTATEHKGKTAVFTGDGETADPISASEAKTYTHEGMTFRMHNCVQQSLAFKPGQSEAAGATFVTKEVIPTLQAQNNGSTAVPAVLQGIDFRSSALTGDLAHPVQAGCKGQTPGTIPHVLAFVKTHRATSADDAEIWREGEVAPTVTAKERDHHDGQTQAVALQFRGFSHNPTHASPQEANPREVLRALRREIGEEAFAEWGLGILVSFYPQEVLRQAVHGLGLRCSSVEEFGLVYYALSCEEVGAARAVQQVRSYQRSGRPPLGWEPHEQRAFQLGAYLSQLSQPGASGPSVLHGLWEASEGPGVLRQALSAVQAVGESARSKSEPAHHIAQVRRLTPVECEFLMGMPRNFTLISWKGKPPADCPDGPRYKALGNSMAVPVMRWIGLRMHLALTYPAVLEPKP